MADTQVSAPETPGPAKMPTAQVLLLALVTTAVLYLAKPVILPIVIACIVAMALKPLIRWLSRHRIPPPLSTAAVLCLLVVVVGIGFLRLSGPALKWLNDAPENLTELRRRVQGEFRFVTHVNLAAAAVNDLGASEEEKRSAQRRTTIVEVRDQRGTQVIMDWTGSTLALIGETLVLVYLLLASGDLFLRKLVHLMPTLGDKKRAVMICHEIQHNISHYLFSVSLINVCLGIVVSGGLYSLGVPNALMWGMLAAALNFIPYFGPIAGVILLTVVGMLSFDRLWMGLFPAIWYLFIHLLEANIITPVLLGRRFTLNPVVIFVAVIFWTWLWGVPGALLAVPILVTAKVVCDRIPALSSVSEVLAN